MTNVPDPQPPAPEASVDAPKRCYRCDSIDTEERATGLWCRVCWDWALRHRRIEQIEAENVALAARLREAELERDEAQDALQGLAMDHYFARVILVARVRELEEALREWLTADPHWIDFDKRVRALLGSGEEQEPGA